MAILELDNVTKRFGGLTAMKDVSFKVQEGEIRGLIGPNGAGKSTTFKNITGYYVPTLGDIRYKGESVAGTKPHAMAKKGVVRTFQETTLFQEFTVFENVLAACHLKASAGGLRGALGLKVKHAFNAKARVEEVLEFMGLSERRDQLASMLPLGSQRALAISIALASDPSLLLMDEPFAGMNPEETNRMMALTRKVRDSGVTIVLVEHDMKAVMGLCDNLTVLNFGQLLAEGTPKEIRENEKVIKAYLGDGG